MIPINKAKFFEGYRREFGPIPAEAQGMVDNLDYQLGEFGTDIHYWNDLRHVAYALATQVVETARPTVVGGKKIWLPTFGPGFEIGGQLYFEKRYGYQTRKGKELGNTAPGDGYRRRGRGLVQLTGKANDAKMQLLLKRVYGLDVDLIAQPELAATMPIAFKIMSIGMHTGAFTGRSLSRYIDGPLCDYRGARKIINGVDRAAEIAGYAVKFEKILREAAA